MGKGIYEEIDVRIQWINIIIWTYHTVLIFAFTNLTIIHITGNYLSKISLC